MRRACGSETKEAQDARARGAVYAASAMNRAVDDYYLQHPTAVPSPAPLSPPPSTRHEGMLYKRGQVLSSSASEEPECRGAAVERKEPSSKSLPPYLGRGRGRDLSVDQNCGSVM